MKKYILLLIILCTIKFVYSDNKNYPVNEIPKELLKNSKMVVREKSSHFTIMSPGKGEMEVKEVYTIMNNAGLINSYFIKVYNSFMKIKNIKGVFYDKNGDIIKKLKRIDLIDIPVISGYSLYEDNRVIAYKPDIDDYPFTVEYTYTVKYNGLFSYPRWQIFNDYNVAIEKSKFKVTAPAGLEFRKHYQKLEIEPEIAYNDKEVTYTWEVKNMPPIDDEPFSPPIENFAPTLYLAPTEFEISGYRGEMQTWKQFGGWISDLNEGRNNIPWESKTKIFELVKDIDSDKDKIDTLYKYLQNKTRYVNVAVGIGGWQPFETEVVDRLSYGDCKALSFYMKSLLEIAGIKSYYTLVNAGSEAEHILSDFPMNQFNHAFLCVPLQKDTIWLECTSQIVPTGYIGDFTDDRDVLIIDHDSSKLIRSPVYTLKENVQIRNIVFKLNETGEGVATINTTYHGLSGNHLIHRINLPVEDNKKWLYKNLGIKDFVIKHFDYSIDRKEVPDVYENIELNVRNYAVPMADRLIIPLNLMDRIDNVPKQINDRKTNIIKRRSERKVDTIIYELPKNYKIENIPDKVYIKTKYGEYKSECKIEERTVIYIRKLDLYKGEYLPEEYNKFREFYKEMNRADKNKFVLKKI